MMIDEVSLSGREAYLRRPDGAVGLQAGETGASRPIVKGEAVEVEAIDLFLEIEDALDLFARADQPILSIELHKEVFPGFLLDPHSHRVHQVAGFEDFRRAEKTDMTVLEIDGTPTLVSPGNTTGCSWRSARYRLAKPCRLRAAAWTLAASRGTPADALGYRIELVHWPAGSAQLNDSLATSLSLTTGMQRPPNPRHRQFDSDLEIGGFQILFKADVHFDTALLERHGSLPDQSVGTPLLQAVFLVERQEPVYALYSLQELVNQSTSYQLLDPAAPVRRMTARVHFPAVLTEGEQLSLIVHSEKIRRCEARMDGTVRQRPPEIAPGG